VCVCVCAIYILIYERVCVCVCMCVCTYRRGEQQLYVTMSQCHTALPPIYLHILIYKQLYTYIHIQPHIHTYIVDQENAAGRECKNKRRFRV
jgi:hypothetical protein